MATRPAGTKCWKKQREQCSDAGEYPKAAPLEEGQQHKRFEVVPLYTLSIFNGKEYGGSVVDPKSVLGRLDRPATLAGNFPIQVPDNHDLQRSQGKVVGRRVHILWGGADFTRLGMKIGTQLKVIDLESLSAYGKYEFRRWDFTY